MTRVTRPDKLDPGLGVSRRLFARALGAGGVGAIIASDPSGVRSAASTETGPQDGDFTNPSSRHAALLGVLGSGSAGKARFEWFDGTTFAVAPAGSARPIFGVRGVSMIRVTGGDRITRREIGHFYDLKTRLRLGAFRNPFTGRTVQAAPQIATVSRALSDVDAGEESAWSLQGSTLIFTESVDNIRIATLELGDIKTIRRATAAQTIVHIVSAKRVPARGGDVLQRHGHWWRTGAWAPCLDMSGSQGICLTQGRFESLARLDRAPSAIQRDLDQSGWSARRLATRWGDHA